MSDRYLTFANSSTGRRLVGALGLPAPVRLERWMAGRVRLVDGALLLGGEGELLQANQFEGMVGQSPLMLAVFKRIRRVAPHLRTALVTGAIETTNDPNI